MDGRALESPTLRTDKAEVVEDASNKVTNEKATNEIQLGEASVRESSSESRESEWSSEVNHGLREGSSADRTLELCKTLIRWIGCAVLLTASLLRFSVLSLPYFLLFLLNFLHITKNYFQYYLPQKKSIVLLGALSTYSFSCIIFELVIAILLGTGKYVPTTTTLRSLESVGVADFHKSVSAGLRGILPDIFVFVFAFTSLFINWFLWKKIIPVSFNNLSEQANPLSSSLPSIVRLQGQILDQRGDFVSRSVPPKVAVVCFYSFLFLLSLTFASVATAIAMLVVDFVLLAWCLGPVTFARWSNVLVEDDKLKEASYYERRLLAQVPPSLPDRLVAKVLSFFKHMDLTVLKMRVALIVDLLLLIYVLVLYIFQWPWLSSALSSNACRVIGIVPLGHSNAPQWPYNLTFAFAISCFCIGGLFIEGSLIALNAVANQKSVLGQTGYERQDATSGNTEEESTSEYLWNQLFFSESNFLSIAYQVVPFFSNLSIVIWALVFPGALSTILMVAAGFCFLFPNLVNRARWLILIYMMCIVIATNLYNAVPTLDISLDSQKKALEAGLKRADTTIWVMAIEMLSVILVVFSVRLYYQVGRRRAFLNSELRRQAQNDNLRSLASPPRFSKWTKLFSEDLFLDQLGLKESLLIDWRDSQDADSILVFLMWFAVPLEACAMVSLFFSAGVIVSAVDSVFLILLGVVGLLYLLPVSRIQSWIGLISWNVAVFYQVVVLVMNGCICRFMSGGAHCHISGGIVGSELSSLFAYVVFLCIGSLQVSSVRMRYLKKFRPRYDVNSTDDMQVVSEETSYRQTFYDSKLPYSLSVVNEFFRSSWLYICYILIVADALLFPANYLAFAYLLMALLLLVIELVISVRVEPRQIVSRVWFIIVLFSAAIVALRYIVRFRSIYSSLSSSTAHAVIRAGIDAGVGFQIGDVIVYVATVLQARLFGKYKSLPDNNLKAQLIDDAGRRRGILARLFSLVGSFVSTLFIWSSRLVLVIMVLVSSIWLSGVSALSYVYIFLCVIILLFESEAKYNYVLELKMSFNNTSDASSENVETTDRNSLASSVEKHRILNGIVVSKHVSSVWTATLLALYSFGVICVQLFYIVWVFQGHSQWNAAYWLGLASGPRSVPIGSKRMAGNILILVFSVLHRLAQRTTLREIDQKARRNSSQVKKRKEAALDDGSHSMKRFIEDSADAEEGPDATAKFVTKASQFFFFLHRVWWWSCVDITLVYLMMSAVIVRTIVSLIYCVLVALLVIPRSQFTSRRYFWFPAWVLSLLLIVQYAVSLGLWPPESHIVHWPWLDLSVAWQQWFFIDVGFRGYDWSLALTFGGLLLCALVLDAEREEKLKKRFAIEEQDDGASTLILPFYLGNDRAVRFFQFFGSIGFAYFVLTYTFAAATSIPNVMTYIFILSIFIVIWKFKWFVLPPYFFWKTLLFYTLFVLFVQLLVQFPLSLGNPSTSWESILGCYKAHTKHGTQFFCLLLFLFTFLIIECRINENIHDSILKPGIQRLHMKRFLLAVQDYCVRYFRNRELFRVLEEDREARKIRLHKIKEIRANREKKLREEENILNPLGEEENVELDEIKLKQASDAQKKMSNDDELFAMQLSAPEAPAPGEVTDALQGGISQWRNLREFASQTASTLRSGAATRSMLSRNSLSRPSMSVRDSVPASTRVQQQVGRSPMVVGPTSPGKGFSAKAEGTFQVPETATGSFESREKKRKLFGIAATEAAKDNVSVGSGYVDYSGLTTGATDQAEGSALKKLSLDASIEEKEDATKAQVGDGIEWMDDSEYSPTWLQTPVVVWLKFIVTFLFLHSNWMVYFFMVFAFLMNRTLLTFVYVMYLFLFLFIEWPRPRRAAWMCLLTYVEAVIVFKLVVLLPALANPTVGVAAKSCGGVHYFYIANSKINTVTICTLGTGVFFDVLVLFSILLHRVYLWSQGLWDVDIIIEAITNKESTAEDDSNNDKKNAAGLLFSKVFHPFRASGRTQQQQQSPVHEEPIFMSENVIKAALSEGIFQEQANSQQNSNGILSSNYVVTSSSPLGGSGPYILAQNASSKAQAFLKISKISFGARAPNHREELKKTTPKQTKPTNAFRVTLEDSDGFFMRSEVWVDLVPTPEKSGEEDGIVHQQQGEEETGQEKDSSATSLSSSCYRHFDLKDSILFEKEGWISEMQQPESNFARKLQRWMPSFLFQYFQRILCTDGIKPGADYYLLSFIIDFICLLYMLFLFPLMFAPADARVAVTETAWWSTNLMSLKQILTLLALFVGLILERIFYLRRLMLGKLILYYANVIVFNLVIFVIGDFDQRATLIVFYVLKLISFVLGGLQVREGFPPYTHGQFLLRRFSAWGMFFFNLYYMTPFLYEFRTILDWTMIPTSMELFDWMKYSDVWISLYRNKAMNNNRAWQKRWLGKKRIASVKFWLGAMLVLLLSFLLWIPFIVFSAINPFESYRPIEKGRLSLSLAAGSQWEIYQSEIVSPGIATSSQRSFASLLNVNLLTDTNQGKSYYMEFGLDSNQIWQPPLHLISNLEKQLSSGQVQLLTALSIESGGGSTYQYVSSSTLNATESSRLSESLHSKNTSGIHIPFFLPRYFAVDSTTSSSGLSVLGKGIESACVKIVFENVTREGVVSNGTTFSWNETQMYWQVASCVASGVNCSQCSKNSALSGANRISDSVATSSVVPGYVVYVRSGSSGGVLGKFAAGGILALVVYIFFSIGGMVRRMFENEKMEIPYYYMPFTDNLLSLVYDIIRARQDGDLAMEEFLFWELIDLYRSQERLVKWSGERQLYPEFQWWLAPFRLQRWTMYKQVDN